MGIRSLTVKERSLLHLFDFSRYREEYEVPEEVTQSGIARAAGIRVTHVPQYLRPLIQEGHVEERTTHIRKQSRRRKAYFLTESGRQTVATQRSALLKETVRFRTKAGAVVEVPLSQVYQEDRRGSRLLELLDELQSAGYVTDQTKSDVPALVHVTQEAPEVTRFYGRGEDLDRLTAALGKVPVVILTGIAGVGKTTLGSKLCGVLREKRSLFWRQVRPWDSALDLASSVAQFLKSFGKVGLHSAVGAAGPREFVRWEELLRTDAAGVDALLVFDDVHESSEDAKAMLGLLLRVAKQQKSFSLLLISRTVPDFYSRREVVVEGSVAEIPLKGLDPSSCGSLLGDAGITGAAAEDLTRISGGVPLFLKLLAGAGPPGPSSGGWSTLEAYIAEQIEPALPDDELRCVQCASLYLVPVPSGGLLLEDGITPRTVVGLQRRGLLDPADGERFALHAALREYFHRGLPVERRESLASKVVPWLREAAKGEGGHGNPRLAMAYLRNAIAIEKDQGTLASSVEELADLQSQVGEYVAANISYAAAQGIVSDAPTLVRLCEKASRSFKNCGALDESAREIERGLALLPSTPSPPAARLLFERAGLAFHRQDFDRAVADLDTATGWLPALPEDLDLKMGMTHLRALIYRDDPQRRDLALAKAEMEATIEAAEALKDPFSVAWIRLDLAMIALETGKASEALDQIEKCLALAEETGALAARRVGLFVKAWYRMSCQGAYAEAEALFQETHRLAKEARLPLIALWHHRHFADLFRRQGRWEEARESLDYFLTASEGKLRPETRIESLGFMARLRVQGGMSDEAEKCIVEAESLLSKDAEEIESQPVAWARAALHVARTEPEAAVKAFEQALRLSPPGRGGRSRTIQEYLALPTHNGELLLEYGRFLKSARKRSKAKEVLRSAIGELEAHCLEPWAQAAREALAP